MRILYHKNINNGSIPCTEGYGLLYNYPAATDARNISSSDDWVVPRYTLSSSGGDFEVLANYLGGAAVGGSLKETGYIYWNSPNTSATNSTNFNGRGAGWRWYDDSSNFSRIKERLYIWTDCEGSVAGTGVIGGFIQYDTNTFIYAKSTGYSYSNKSTGLSVRLIYVGAGTPTSYTGNDGTTYRIIQIGSQYWLADNLQETKFRNGDIIPYHGVDNGSNFTNAEWAALTTAGVAAYNNDVSLVGCDFSFPEEPVVFTDVNYGYLYNWYAATDVRSITSSDDWVVPSSAQFNTLYNYVGTNNGFKLMETGTNYWDAPNTIATNEYLFNARGTGGRSRENAGGGVFSGLNTSFYFWTSYTSGNGIMARILSSGVLTSVFASFKYSGYPLRLLYVGAGTPTSYTDNSGNVYGVVQIGTQFWLDRNLVEKKYRNGNWITGYDGGTYTPISNAVWAALTTEAMCVYNDDTNNV